MDIVLDEFKWKICDVYLRDIIVFYKSFDEHNRHVYEVLDFLRSAGFSLKLANFDFFKTEVVYLGYIIPPVKLAVASRKTKCVQNIKTPRTQSKLKSFLGLHNVCRRFVPYFSDIAET